MKELFVLIRDELMNMLNPSAFTTDSIEGLLLIGLIVYMIYHMTKKTKRIIKFCLEVMLVLQIGYWLSLTSLNNLIDLKSIFKYDIITAIAQVFVGTKICDMLIDLNAIIKTIFIEIGTVLQTVFMQLCSTPH